MLCSEVKQFSCGAVAKASLNRATLVARHRPETRRSSHEQVEAVVTHRGGPNSRLLKKSEMTCG